MVLSRAFFSTSSKASTLWHSVFFMVQFSHPYMTTMKTTALTIWTFIGTVVALLFNMLSRFVIPFFPRSECLLISWLQSPFTEILEPRKIKSGTSSTFSTSIRHEVMKPEAMVLVFWMLSFKPAFSLSSFTLLKDTFWFLPLEGYHQVIWGCWYFSHQSWFQHVLHPVWHFTFWHWYTLYIS